MFQLAKLLVLAAVGFLPLGCGDVLESYEYGTVAIQATRRSGDPVPGVKLILYAGDRHVGYGVTDGAGRFTFDFVPEGSYGVYALAADGYAFMGHPVSEVVDGIGIEPGESQEIQFKLLKYGNGVIEVEVVTTGGEPVSGVRVAAYTFRGVVAQGVTDQSGRSTLEALPFGNYGVSLRLPRGLEVASGEGFVDGLLIEEGVRERVRFSVARCAGTIRANVLDENSRPVSGYPVAVYTHEGVVAEGRTDPQGLHTFTAVPCGNYGVALRPQAGFSYADQRGGSYVDGILITRDAERQITFRVDRCEGRIKAEVVDGSGSPVPHATIVLYTFRGVVERRVTDAAGVADFASVPCLAGYGLSVEPPASYTVRSGKGSSYYDGIDVVENSNRSFSFVLTRG